MNRTELTELIQNGENSGVEFKRDTEDNRALAKELVAFANLRGGRVLLGVEKNRTFHGLTRYDPGTGAGDAPRTYDRLEEWVMQAGRDRIRPEIIPYFEIIRDVEPGLDVAVVEVERGWSAHHVWHDQPNGPRYAVWRASWASTSTMCPAEGRADAFPSRT